MKKSVIFLIAFIGVLSSCMKESGDITPSSMKEDVHGALGLRIPVRMERTVTKGSDDEFEFCFEKDTKVDISSSTGAATWTAGDQVAFCESNGVNRVYLSADVDTETDEISVMIDDGYSPAYYAIYPASAAGSNMTTPTVVYADFYDMEDVENEETFCMAPMVAVNDGGDLDFYHTGGILRLTLKGVPPGTKKIRVTANGMTYITGTYTVSNAGTSSATTTVSSGSHNYVEFTKSTDFNALTVLNVPLPAGDYSSCTGMTVVCYNEVSSTLSSHTIDVPWITLGRARGKKARGHLAIDLSLINPLTREPMSRETANCYVVTAPGEYCLPLFYGNAVVNGADNISTAAPAKVNANDGVFVNAYDVAISSGNIKTDLKNAGQTLNTSGGKLIWSTGSATSNALVTVDTEIRIEDGVGFLSFSVPSERFQQGSALIGVLKDGSTTEYVWAWHIWITNGNVLETEEYANYQSNRINFLNRPLGGRGGTSLVNAYYQFGMPFPLPPSNGYSYSSGNGYGVTAILYDENGTYTFSCGGSTITTLGKALSQPDHPRINNAFYNNASGSAQNFYNMWDATQATSSADKTVVKTIYDPSPAGMSVPRLNAFTGFTATGWNITSGAPTNCRVVGSYASGWNFKKNSSDAVGSFWGTSGYRTEERPSAIGSTYGQGRYWTASAQSNVSYSLYFGKTVVYPEQQSNTYRYYGYSVRPALIEN